jgi:hypothetical protein
MSFDPVLWAMKDAPVGDVEEWAVVVCMSEYADDDGCTAMPSHSTIAKRTRMSVPTVKRRIAELARRGVIARGDQSAALVYPADRRPVVWDLMIPCCWFPSLDRIQEYRVRVGRPPLTEASRPDLGPAPERRRRADLKVTETGGSTRPGGLQDRGVLKSEGSSRSPRGVFLVATGGLQDPLPSPLTLPLDLPKEAPLRAAPAEPDQQPRHRNTATPAARIANAVYDHTQRQVSWEGMHGIAKRALLVKDATEESVAAAMTGLWDSGKPVIQQTVGQVLSGVIDHDGRPVNRTPTSTANANQDRTNRIFDDAMSRARAADAAEAAASTRGSSCG